MAESKVVVESQDEILRRLWIVKALELQKSVIMRARNKDIPGTELYHVRTREIQFIDKLIEEFKK